MEELVLYDNGIRNQTDPYIFYYNQRDQFVVVDEFLPMTLPKWLDFIWE